MTSNHRRRKMIEIKPERFACHLEISIGPQVIYLEFGWNSFSVISEKILQLEHYL